jgi:hypothetical protein
LELGEENESFNIEFPLLQCADKYRNKEKEDKDEKRSNNVKERGKSERWVKLKKEEGNKDICRNIFFDDRKKVVKRVMIICTCKRILKMPL